MISVPAVACGSLSLNYIREWPKAARRAGYSAKAEVRVKSTLGGQHDLWSGHLTDADIAALWAEVSHGQKLTLA